MNKNLVVLRSGQSSLHHHWLAGDAARNWDLVLCPYQATDYAPVATVIPPSLVEGQKWVGICSLLTNWQGWRDYDYIWLPDDDLLSEAATINALFELSRTFRTKLSAPALSADSFYCHPTTMQNRSFFARAVTFIEIMMPCLHRDVLDLVLPSIAIAKSGYGWGLDFLWPHMINYRDMVIFDCITVRHTRPVAAVRDRLLIDLAMRERQTVTSAIGDRRIVKTLGAYDAQRNFRAADAGGFLLDYLNGYHYLTEQNDQTLAWLIEQQG